MKSLKQIVRKTLMKGGLLPANLSEEEFEQVVDAGTLSGAIDVTEQELIKSILQFSDLTAKEIMVPRPDVVALNIDMPRDVIVRKVIEEGYSRLPVYRGSLDHIIGIIYSKDLLSLLEHRDLIILQDIIRPVFFVPESVKISLLLRQFQQKKVHMGIVVDEFGQTEGLVTIEDIIEEIVGDILDEYDEAHRPVLADLDGSTVVDGIMKISEFNRQFLSEIPEAPEYETLAGYLNVVTGHLPDLQEEIHTEQFHFKILSKSARRIRQIRVTPIAPAGSESAAGNTTN
jgi:CBS domain containing-hemolysin-like protein